MKEHFKNNRVSFPSNALLTTVSQNQTSAAVSLKGLSHKICVNKIPKIFIIFVYETPIFLDVEACTVKEICLKIKFTF
jgi:hypothetical protein